MATVCTIFEGNGFGPCWWGDRWVVRGPAGPFLLPRWWRAVRSGMTVFLHGAAATPTPLINALAARSDLENVRIVHLHTKGTAPYVAPEKESAFRAVSLFTGAPLRQAVAEGRADFMPVFLSDVPHCSSPGHPARRRDPASLRAGPAWPVHARHFL